MQGAQRQSLPAGQAGNLRRLLRFARNDGKRQIPKIKIDSFFLPQCRRFFRRLRFGLGLTVKGGIRLELKKEATLTSWTIRRPPPPVRVRIPLQQCQEGPSVPLVKVGDEVRLGQKIAAPENSSSVALHASISGKVTAISAFDAGLESARAIEIESSGAEEKAGGMGTERTGWERLSASELLTQFQDFGLVSLAPGMASLHRKFSSGKIRRHTLVLNGCESEPYLTSEHALMMSHPVEIVKGAELLRRALQAERIILALEDNKLEAGELLKSKIYFLKWKQVEVKIFPSFFPQQAEPLLLRSLLKTDSSSLAAHPSGFLFENIATAFAVFEAVALQKPLVERAVTVGGECVVEPKNLWLRIGTRFEDALKLCRGLLREPRKVIRGGPMTGEAESHLGVPVVKGTQAILALPKEVARPVEIQPCIRCGRCLEACPVEISPAMITLAAERNLWEVAEDYGIRHCIACGNCAYVCPSKRPMVELIRYASSRLGGRNSET